MPNGEEYPMPDLNLLTLDRKYIELALMICDDDASYERMYVHTLERQRGLLPAERVIHDVIAAAAVLEP